MHRSMSTTNVPAAGAPVKPWYAQRWPWLLMLGPATVIVAGAYTTWIAFSRQDALVVDDYYKQGQSINQDLRRDALASRLKMQIRLNYDATEGKLDGVLKSGVGAMAQNIRLHLIHPTLPQNDMAFDTRTDAAGRFEIALPMLQMTRWQIQAEDQQRSWRLTGEWTWPQQKQVDIKADTGSAG